MRFFDALAHSLKHDAAIESGDRVLVAFSGGLDSTALLWGLHCVAPRLQIEVAAAHLDHSLDRGSAARARAAVSTAARLGIPCAVERRPIASLASRAASRPQPRRGLEAEGRHQRYAFLEEQRLRFQARYIATAHHRDDQAETVLLRLLFGSGLEGLAGIQAVRPHLIRPLLSLPRSELRKSLDAAGLTWVEDPTNQDLARPRNRIRHLLLPRLNENRHDLSAALSRLARTTAAMRRSLDRRLRRELRPRPDGEDLVVLRSRLEAIPAGLQIHALRFLHREAGIPYPPSSAAHRELRHQLANGKRIGCDCGDGWRWVSRGNFLHLRTTRPKTPDFTYTLKVPGSLELKELSLRFSVRPARVSPWMFRTASRRSALALPIKPGERVTIRNRRAGDRIQPLGWERNCRVKELLINRHVPKEQRSRLPFLCCGETIAWIPGVTINERFRLSSEQESSEQEAWVAEIKRV